MEKSKNTFVPLGKRKMIELMKEQFEYFTDKDASSRWFHYDRYGNSERLNYYDDYDNAHDLYHSIVGGEEMCLYHKNNDRNRRVILHKELENADKIIYDYALKKSVVYSLKEYQKEIDTHPEANNLEPQRVDQER